MMRSLKWEMICDILVTGPWMSRRYSLDIRVQYFKNSLKSSLRTLKVVYKSKCCNPQLWFVPTLFVIDHLQLFWLDITITVHLRLY
ncbi:hypothetical protein MKW98_014663 [Papaver atlanticum]|uniref:Uncharacterized protein n=1 Tax=Papaver atlanticum TaxID=357466 RepID=A0AAD4SHW8_9MAGN|nr:hypothetical protein MKW98_014663 [Papaver atlanticum]